MVLVPSGQGGFSLSLTDRIFALLLSVLLLLPIGPVQAGTTKGSFAFYYTGSLTDEELAWLQRFNVVVPGDILPPSQVQLLHQGGSKLFFYEWSTGLYIDNPAQLDPNSWEAKVYKNHNTWLLNPNQPDAGPDGLGRSYYYDPYPLNFKKAWADLLSTTRLNSTYQGVFFDLVGSPSVPQYLQTVYASRHPKVAYDKSLADAFKLLRQKGSLIFTNHGFTKASYYFPVADYDLTESMMTSFAWGQKVRIYVEGIGLMDVEETFYQTWTNLKQYVDDIQSNVKRYNPAVKILHLNYTNPFYQPTGASASVNGVSYPVYREEIDRAAIYYGYAAAKLWDQDSYSQGPTVALSQDEVYFTDLGQPLGQSYEERGGVVLRYYQNGVVVLNPSTVSQTVNLNSPLIPLGMNGLQDLYEGVSLFGFTVTIDPTPSSASGRIYPSGRVYLYQR